MNCAKIISKFKNVHNHLLQRRNKLEKKVAQQLMGEWSALFVNTASRLQGYLKLSADGVRVDGGTFTFF